MTLLTPAFMLLTAQATGVEPRALARSLAGVAGATAGMVGALLLTRLGLRSVGLGEGERLLLLVGVGLLAYAPLLLLFDRRVLRDAQEVVSRLRESRS